MENLSLTCPIYMLAPTTCFQLVRPVVFAQDFRHRQAVEDGVDVIACIGKSDALQAAAVHELDMLAELPFLEAPIVRNTEGLLLDLHGLNPVSCRLLHSLTDQKLRIQPQYPRNLILLQIITFSYIVIVLLIRRART